MRTVCLEMTVFFSLRLPFQCTPLAMRKKQGTSGKILKKLRRRVPNVLFAAKTPWSARLTELNDGAVWFRTTAPLIRSSRGPLPCLSAEFWMCHIRLPLLLRHWGLTGTFFFPVLSFSTHPRVPLQILGMLSSFSLAPDRCTVANGICFCGRQVVKRDSQ